MSHSNAILGTVCGLLGMEVPDDILEEEVVNACDMWAEDHPEVGTPPPARPL